MKKSILVVEDNQDLADFYRIILEEEGYKTQMTDNSDDTLTYIKENSCNLILLDILLDEESGKEILREIKKSFTVPVVVISNLPHERGDCLSLGAEKFLVKSETAPEEIVEVVNQILAN